jgi:hypothetical protein
VGIIIHSVIDLDFIKRVGSLIERRCVFCEVRSNCRSRSPGCDVIILLSALPYNTEVQPRSLRSSPAGRENVISHKELTCEILGYVSGVAGGDAVLGDWFPTFRNIALPSY